MQVKSCSTSRSELRRFKSLNLNIQMHLLWRLSNGKIALYLSDLFGLRDLAKVQKPFDGL